MKLSSFVAKVKDNRSLIFSSITNTLEMMEGVDKAMLFMNMQQDCLMVAPSDQDQLQESVLQRNLQDLEEPVQAIRA